MRRMAGWRISENFFNFFERISVNVKCGNGKYPKERRERIKISPMPERDRWSSILLTVGRNDVVS